MNTTITLKQIPQLHFIPVHWTDTFMDTIVETYISLTETQTTYGQNLSPLPFSFQLNVEEEMIELCDNITCDIEYGVESIDKVMFDNEGQFHEFCEISRSNLSLFIYDINRVLDFHHMSYRIGDQFRNIPIKGVW